MKKRVLLALLLFGLIIIGSSCPKNDYTSDPQGNIKIANESLTFLSGFPEFFLPPFGR